MQMGRVIGVLFTYHRCTFYLSLVYFLLIIGVLFTYDSTLQTLVLKHYKAPKYLKYY